MNPISHPNPTPYTLQKLSNTERAQRIDAIALASREQGKITTDLWKNIERLVWHTLLKKKVPRDDIPGVGALVVHDLLMKHWEPDRGSFGPVLWYRLRNAGNDYHQRNHGPIKYPTSYVRGNGSIRKTINIPQCRVDATGEIELIPGDDIQLNPTCSITREGHLEFNLGDIFGITQPQDVLQQIDNERVLELLEDLPVRKRYIMKQLMEGCTRKSIADSLGMTVFGVRNHINETVKILRKKLIKRKIAV